MTPQSRSVLRAEVMRDEGTGPVVADRFLPYLDCCGKFWRECVCKSKGILTIAWGHNIDHNGVTRLEAEVLLDHDLASAEMECRKAFPWFADLNDVRQRVLVNMCFNLGLPKLQGFHKTLACIAGKDYERAATAMLASKWAAQVGSRAVRLARMMRDGR